MALSRTLPTFTNDLLPGLMVEVCLVLAPDVNFFLTSRKQGLPCRRCLFFFVFFTGLYPAGFLVPVLSVRDRLTSTHPDAILVFTHPLNPNHLPLLTCNWCSTLNLKGNCAEFTISKLMRGVISDRGRIL